jgi:cell division protein ZapA
VKQIDVTILGQSYLLGCPEGGETPLLAAVKRVDAEMVAIRAAGRVKSRERIAVLAALNLAYALAERAAASPASNTAGVDIDALVRRLDVALGADGQLL